MKLVFIFLALSMSSCQAFPQIAQTIDDIATEDTVKVAVGKEAFQKQKNINVMVEIQNEKKDQ